MTLPQSWSLRCCDSSKDYRKKLNGVKAESRNIANECYATTTKTHAREAMERNKGYEGKDCDYCTVELFVTKEVKAIRDTQGAITADGKPSEHYYHQSCGSYNTANFEYKLANIDLENLKNEDEVEKDKAKAYDDKRWSSNFLTFGADLAEIERASVK